MKKIILVISVFLSTCLGCSYIYTKYSKVEEKIIHDTIFIEKIILPKFISGKPKDNLMEALQFYNIEHPEIVYAQAILETGNFTSGGCTRDNNLFGIMSKNGHVKFNHWIESVEAYKNWIQYKYKPNEDYYHFLKRIGYAEDSNYINKLQTIVSNNYEI